VDFALFLPLPDVKETKGGRGRAVVGRRIRVLGFSGDSTSDATLDAEDRCSGTTSGTMLGTERRGTGTASGVMLAVGGCCDRTSVGIGAASLSLRWSS
jgi:hypothetical protein